MIGTKTFAAKIDVVPELRIPVLIQLEKEGWKPAILDSQRAFVNNAGINDWQMIDNLRIPEQARYLGPGALPYLSEIFFQEKDIFYLAFYDERTARRYQAATSGEGLEIGLISPDLDKLDVRLEDFAGAVERAFKASVDGRKARHMKFEWTQRRPARSYSSKLREDSNAAFAPASFTDRDVQLSNALTNQSVRLLLIELSQAGFAREQDLVKRWGKKREEFDNAVASLKSNSLITTEYLLECKRSNAPLVRFRDKTQLEDSRLRDLVCPTCGSSFEDERLSEGYTVAEDGRRMSAKSHWMTIWISNVLHDLGVPLEAILWNLSENGEEVDILVDFLGQIWIFELKDREFGAGDAHPLNYRQVRFKASKSVIVTTERVSADAKRVFAELDREVRSRRRNVVPIYIEGLAQVRDVLNRELAKVSLGHASSLVASIGLAAGFNLSSILAVRFGESIESVQEETDFPF